ncbi:MAG: hypothetical protein AABZ80_13865 [Gemmatimonadota bacterium]
MRIQLLPSILVALVTACATAPVGGPLGEGAPDYPNITAVDSAYPPTSVSVRLDKDAYAVLVLVAPGHSATLLYPTDSTTNNRLSAGPHDIAFRVPGPLARSDSQLVRRANQQRQRFDSAGRARSRSSATTTAPLPPLMPSATTYLLVVTSPQPLVYARVIEKTAGWSIPLDGMEALNSVAKQVKSTITGQSRDWSAAYHVVVLTQPKK